MALIALITDTHHGVRNDNKMFREHLKKFYDNVFFPTLDKYNIKQVIHLGDLVDRRKYINYVTFRRLKTDFILPLQERGIHCTYLVGNHDVYYKNTNEVNALHEFFGKDYGQNVYDENLVSVVTRPTEIEIGNKPILLLPWICEDNEDQSKYLIETTVAPIVLGHLEINGFEMDGRLCDHGLNPELFSKFLFVGTGHFHKKHSKDNIHYLGAPYQMTWGDYEQQRGFHLFDTETFELTFVENPYTVFHKLHWDDTYFTLEEIENLNDQDIYNCYVKIFVQNKTNPTMLELLIAKLEELGADVTTIDDRFSLEETGEVTPEQAEDTPTIMKNYIDSVKVPNPDKLKAYMQTLYVEALYLE